MASVLTEHPLNSFSVLSIQYIALAVDLSYVGVATAEMHVYRAQILQQSPFLTHLWTTLRFSVSSRGNSDGQYYQYVFIILFWCHLGEHINE